MSDHPLVSLPGARRQTVTAYKLLRQRRNGTLAPLFINCRQIIPLKTWLAAEDHPTKGYAHRPGWHAAAAPVAPHLRTTGQDRIWCKVLLRGWLTLARPAAQGGVWYLAERMKVLRRL